MSLSSVMGLSQGQVTDMAWEPLEQTQSHCSLSGGSFTFPEPLN